MADELLDLVDKNDNVIGTVWKSEAHGNPNLIHREVRIFLFDDKCHVLLQQRSFTKKVGPGLWVETVAGHVTSGENPKTAAVRELQEELGINIKLDFFKKVFDIHHKTGENSESRFTYVYFAIVNKHPRLKLQESEVNDVKWVAIENLEEFSKSNDYSLNGLSHQLIMEIYSKKIKK